VLKHLRNKMEDKNLVEQGFTLIELLIVIVILGILAAVVVFAVSGITDRGGSSACQADVNTLRTAIEAYRAQPTHSATDNPTEAQLKSAGLLNKVSAYYDIDYGTSTFEGQTVNGNTCADETF
jgi:general secretion pathway protein G